MRKIHLRSILYIVTLFFGSNLTNAQVVISQVYGGGGNAGATYRNDFIELFNRGTSSVSLTGWSVQYASSAGTTWAVTNLSGTIAPGQYYLVQEALGTGGTTNLPTPDASGTIAMSATAGKVALVNSTTALTGACPSSASIIDLVGFGTTANCFEGTGPTTAPSNTTSVLRAGNGCTDNNQNSTDFSSGAPNPRNTASPTNSCAAFTVSVAAGTTAAEGGSSGTFNITLSSAAPVGGVTITYTLSGSAVLNTDYTDALNGSITIPESSTTGTITLVVNDDPDFEGTETISILLNSATNGYSIGTASANINLLDNDAPPTVSVASGANAAEPATNGTFTINFSAPTTAPTDVSFEYTGTAGFGTDYSVSYSTGTPSTSTSSGVLTVPGGTSSVIVTINTIDDPDVEGTETITLTLSSPTGGYTVGTPSASINLTSEDVAPPAPISLTGAPYTQDFNSLANTGTTNTLILPGWLLNETGGGARDNEQYAGDNGGSGTGDTYSYGTTSTTERALGSLRSGTLISTFGAFFINNTGGTVSRLKISYTGEQWRLGTINRADQLDFQYSLDATSLTTGTWINIDPLDFVSPFTTTAGAVNGNDPANRRQLSFTITGLSIPDGSIFHIRWNEPDVAGADDGLAVDDFSIETDPVDVAGPAIITLSPANGAINVETTTNAVITFDETIQKGLGNIYVKRVSDNATVQTIDVTSAAVTLTAVNQASFEISGLFFNTNYYVEMDAGSFKDVLNNNFGGISGSSTWSFTTVSAPPPGVIGSTYNFDVCTNPLTNGFTQFSVVGPQKWACTTFGIDPAHSTTGSAPNGMQINGFSGTNIPNEDWLISPSFDITGTTYPLLSYWSRTAFNGLPLKLKVSTDYPGAGNPNNYTWTDLNGRFPSQTSNVWTLSQDINLSAYKSTATYFAFVYYSSDDDGARWTLDDIRIDNSATPPPPSLTVGTTDIQFTYVASGSTADKTFSFTGNDLTGDVTLNATGVFQLSKDGITFSSSLLYTLIEANNITKTVYVRFAPNVIGQNFVGSIDISTSALSATINLKGTSIDPATTLEVVNWNVEWLGSTEFGPTNENQQEQNVKTVMQNIGADIFGLVEVVDEAKLASIVSQIPGYSYVISNYGSHTNTTVNPPSALAQAQKLAFVYKTDMFSNVTTTALVSQGINSAADLSNPAYNYWASGRFPFMMTADVTLNCVTRQVRFILVHAKANTSPTATSYERRKKGADTLHYTLAQLYPEDNIIILGDFNDDLDQSITDGFTITSWNSFTEDGDNYSAVTLPLSLAGKKSTVSYNDVIDHVVISNDLQPYYMTETASILNDVASLVSNYGSTTSDHFPVFSRYIFRNATDPTVTICPTVNPFCKTANNTYSIPVFVATDDCDPVSYSFTISGVTERSGTSNDAGGVFNIGTSTITWTATDNWGNSVTCQTTVVVNDLPVVTIPDAFALTSGVLPNTVYIGYLPASSITLNSVVTGGTPGYLYNWSSGSSGSTSTVSPIATTLYTLTVTDANGCQGSAGKTINVLDIRGGNGKVIICHKQKNTIVVTTSVVNSHLGHGDMLGSCEILPALANNNIAAESNLTGKLNSQVFPNPTRGYFTIQLNADNTNEKIRIRVTDFLGRTIEQKDGIRSGQTIEIGHSYRPGTYIAELMRGKERIVIKLVKLFE